jgi:hypothetical protein
MARTSPEFALRHPRSMPSGCLHARIRLLSQPVKTSSLETAMEYMLPSWRWRLCSGKAEREKGFGEGKVSMVILFLGFPLPWIREWVKVMILLHVSLHP